ncbi:MAG: hydantoinase subunit beta [Acidimicrobiaceae bacterium]|mgnify:CR=1 FL=1|nr:hydantoinase subunit beta [Acidimicrobiaceae bacterium]|tara:strand:+ start:75 stop:1688 length:1614 start_codon:yes stop_codon:yes gene_type:complete
MKSDEGLRIGIDVGGTNTDAAVVDANQNVIAKAKTPTTEDIQGGISNALSAVLRDLEEPTKAVTHVMLGTTHATNAILERRDLNRIVSVRVAGPASHAIPPLFDWPDDLRRGVLAGATIIEGGSELNGEEISAFDGDHLSRFLAQFDDQVDAVAITGVFSPVAPDHELVARDIVKSVLGDVPVSLSHGIGALGLLERENACALNASLLTVAKRIVDGLREAVSDHGLSPQVYIAQNDGTLMGLDYVLRYPVLTIGSGPSNSMRGAAFLTGANDALVVDVGGTSTDIGVMTRGFPRESSTPVEIGGVRTNFRMPDLVSIALGGGTVIRNRDQKLQIGPDSVGFRLVREALVFGGSTPTLTDSAVATSRASLGDASGLKHTDLDFREVMARSDDLLAEAADTVKVSRSEIPLIAVGGGSFLIPDDLPGVSDVHRPEHFEVANAIGAAIASVSGQVDRVYALSDCTRQEALQQAQVAAREEAISAGAEPDSTELVEMEEIPMAYLTEPVVRIRAKVAGALATGRMSSPTGKTKELEERSY